MKKRLKLKQKPLKLFISHSKKDKEFVGLFVELLECMGLNDKNMFLKYKLKVIFVLSDNFYNSTMSVNEMGATWVLNHSYTTILTRGG